MRMACSFWYVSIKSYLGKSTPAGYHLCVGRNNYRGNDKISTAAHFFLRNTFWVSCVNISILYKKKQCVVSHSLKNYVADTAQLNT